MLTLRDISMTFNEGTPDESKALESINLELQEGEFVTIIGSNGAGKSTLMNVISGALIPDVGDVMIDGRQVVHLPEYKRSAYIGRVFQDPMSGTAPSMTVEENMAMAYDRTKKRTLKPGVTKQRKAVFQEQLKMLELGLEDRLNAKVGFLSGGERQALSLLMTTFTDPDILLLDEHTAALDPSRAKLITDLTEEVVEKSGLTTLMVTHDMQQAVDLGTRLIMMDGGKIILDVNGNEKRALTIERLMDAFQERQGKTFKSDRSILG